MSRPKIVMIGVDSTTDRARALDGADYAINMIQVGGYRPCTVTDFEIPRRHGLRQTIGDTLGIGGIMRALRTIPVLIEMAHDMERLCPEVVHLSYVNPMAMNCWALARATRIRTVGLCHSVPLTARTLARDVGVPPEEIDHLVGGINHMAFFLRLEHRGVDLYPRLHRVIAEGRVPAADRVRYEVLARLGYFPTESSEHFSEYVPWFVKRGREDLIRRFHIPLDEYPRRREEQIAAWQELRARLQDPNLPLEVHRSVEYGAMVISAIETGRPARIYGNVVNDGLIAGLPPECVVEVPCLDGSQRRPARAPGAAAGPARGAHQDEPQRPGVDGGGGPGAAARPRVPRRHAGSAHRRRARAGRIHALVDELLAAHAEWIPSELAGGPSPDILPPRQGRSS